MRKKVFISFCEADRNKMLLVKTAIENSRSLESVIVEDKREGAVLLSKLVAEGIKSSDYFVSILTHNSITSQWVNQEVGYATALDPSPEIVPIVESNIIHSLKGFVHNQIQLRYNFESFLSAQKERASFRKCYIDMVADLDQRNLIIDIDNSANSNFVATLSKGMIYSYICEYWLVVNGIRYFIADNPTLERLKQLLNKPSYPIDLSELERLKAGQILKSQGPKSEKITWGTSARNSKHHI